ncbi:Uma2 family endonuclease [Nocardia sp. NPDC050408]|uniref:Uma2 family endonuclease n=1 Tax=Nocardia sp. NPDC050408 TaxID=3364319 RepID=UPI0037933E6A
MRPSDVHLAIEVVSSGTKTRERVLRPAQYAEAGIKCFWRVENEENAIVIYVFELLPEGGYAPTGACTGPGCRSIVVSRSISNCLKSPGSQHISEPTGVRC